MQKPVQVTFRNMPVDDSVEIACIGETEKLERYCGRITGCHVVVAAPHQRQHLGQLFEVRLHLTFPGGEVVVNRVPPDHHRNEQLLVAIREAFDTARRQLEDKLRRQRHQVKAHAVQPHGQVVRLVPGSDHGYIETPDGREIYFHRNSVLNDGFDRLQVGSEVRFAEEEGEQGPRATSVAAVGRHGHLPPTDGTSPHV